MSEEGSPRVYAIRIFSSAEQEIEAAFQRFVTLVDGDVAQQWRAGLRREIARLAAGPRQFPIIPEQRFFTREVRHIVYRRTPSSAAYRVLFVIADSGEDGPTVTIIHVRHGAARPIGRKAARELETPE